MYFTVFPEGLAHSRDDFLERVQRGGTAENLALVLGEIRQDGSHPLACVISCVDQGDLRLGG